MKKFSQNRNKVRFRLENEYKHTDECAQDNESEDSNETVSNANSSSDETAAKEFRVEDELSFLNEDEEAYKEMRIENAQVLNKNEKNGEEEAIKIQILKVHLENNTVKSFKFDKNTCVRDVLASLNCKLNINLIEYFGLVVKLNGENSISKLIFLDENLHLYKINQIYGCKKQSKSLLANCDELNEEIDDDETASETNIRSSDNGYDCLFRFIFIPSNYENLLAFDPNAFNYLYEQVKIFLMINNFLFKSKFLFLKCINDVLNDRFGNELKYEIALHLATLSILHDHVNFNSSDQLLRNSNSSMKSDSSSSLEDDDEELSQSRNLINFKCIE